MMDIPAIYYPKRGACDPAGITSRSDQQYAPPVMDGWRRTTNAERDANRDADLGDLFVVAILPYALPVIGLSFFLHGLCAAAGKVTR